MTNLHQKLVVKGIEIKTFSKNESDYISLTDIAKYKGVGETDDVIKNWMRNRSTIEFLGLWETLNNPNFNPVEFDRFKTAAGSNSFVLSPSKWIVSTKAVGLTTKQGRGGGTLAHKDIALESLNSELITQGISQPESLTKLNQIAISQIKSLLSSSSAKRLKSHEP